MTDLATEMARAKAKYPPGMWAALHPQEMAAALLREAEELKTALWSGDLHGEHGILRESLHVQVVAIRISEEMERRKGVLA